MYIYTWLVYIFNIYDEIIIPRSFRCNWFQPFLKKYEEKLTDAKKKVILYLRQTNWLNKIGRFWRWNVIKKLLKIKI